MLEQQQLSRRLETVIRLAGNRYDTAVNLEIKNVLKNLHALNREPQYLAEILKLAYEIQKENVWPRLIQENTEKSQDLRDLRRNVSSLVKRIIQIKSKAKNEGVRWTKLCEKIDIQAENSFQLYSYFDNLKSQHKQFGQESTDYSHASHSMWRLFRDLRSLNGLLSDERANLFNIPRLLLKGEAGIGKTHLLCDYAKNRLQEGKPVLIFLANELTSSVDPMLAMSNLLNFKRREDFLFSLKRLCDESDERVCIIIDALNEAERVKWSKLAPLHSIKGLSVIISLRNGYDHLVPNKSKYSIVEHTGFAEMEWKALPKFFGHYGLKLPEIPIIDPEFKNPLFLIIFCKAYQGSNKTPRGHGATHVFEKYVENQSIRVLRELGLSLPSDHLWRKVIKPIGIWMGRNGKNRILRPEFLKVIKSDPSLGSHAAHVVNLMERDGLLLKYPHYSNMGKRRGYNYVFTYHRFSDHLIIRSILTENQIQGANASIKARKYLRNSRFLKRIIHGYDGGLLEALAIQIPERCSGDELVWLMPKKYLVLSMVKQAFIEGLKWRDVASCRADGTLKFINGSQIRKYMNNYLRGGDDFHKVIRFMLDVCAIPLHPFNADRLHNYLSRHKLPKRDAWWQQFLVDNDEPGNAIDRLHAWSLSTLPSSASGESVKLAAIALIWTFASTNHALRDTSTRSVIALLENNQGVLLELLRDFFSGNDDPYVTERLFATAYGCVSINPHDRDNFRLIAEHVAVSHFQNTDRMPNALQDDHAKGLVELYIKLYGNDLGVDESIISPPYSYTFPKRLPTIPKLKEKYDTPDYKFSSIWDSLMYGDAVIADFGNYTLSARLHKFSRFPLNKNPVPTEEDKYNEFLNALSSEQKELLDSYQTLYRSKYTLFKLLDFKIDELGKKLDPPRPKLPEIDDRTIKAALVNFENSLDAVQQSHYSKFKKYITSKAQFASREGKKFNLNVARRAIFQRVMQLGWNPDDHLSFDRARHSLDRSKPVKIERIGKKYQWIGLFDFAARLGSNYYLLDDELDWSNPKLAQYKGAYQIGLRDFDPTIEPLWLAERQKNEVIPHGWWVPPYDNWNIANWKTSTDDIPKPGEVIQSKKDGVDYLNLQGWVSWKGENDPPEDEDTFNYPELWMHINAYIVKEEELNTATAWCEDKEFWNGLLPEVNQDSNGVYLKEFGDSAAYMEAFYPYYQRSEWMEKETDRPFDLLMPIEAYDTSNFDGDGSIKNSFDVYNPTYRLKKILKLKPDAEIGSYSSSAGVKMFDPSQGSTPHRETLLVNKDIFLAELKKNNLTIIWTVLGEKMYMRSGGGGEYQGQRLEIHGYCYFNRKGELIERVRYKNEWK